MDIKIIASVFLCLLLTACQPTPTRQYLMQHPEALKKELAICQEKNLTTAYCDQVKEVAADFTVLANAQRENPQAFGLQIQQAEQAVAEAKAHFEQAASAEAKQAYETQMQKVQSMLAVVAALNTPGL